LRSLCDTIHETGDERGIADMMMSRIGYQLY